MNTSRISIILLVLCLSFTAQANNWEETLRVQLNKALPGESFSIESFERTTANKEAKGVGTFFNKSGVQFTVRYDEDSAVGFFEAVMPARSGIGVSNGELANLVGKNLQNLVPDALKKSITLDRFSFHFSKENKKPEQIVFEFKALKDWELLSSANAKLKQIKIRFQVNHPTDKIKRTYTNRLSGLASLGGRSFEVSAILTEIKENLLLVGATEDWSLQASLKAIVGEKSIGQFSVPTNIFNLDLHKVMISFAPYQDWLALQANSNFGAVDLWVQQQDKKKKEYLITITPPKGFKLSQINEKLSVLDVVDLSKHKIVISSERKSKKESSKIPSMAQVSTAVNQGCSMVANLDLTKLKVDHLIGVKNLVVSSPITSQLEHINLDAALDMDIALGESATLKQVIFRLKPSPKNFALSLLGMLETQVDKDQLIFRGGVEIVLSDQSLNFLAGMEGTWNDPLGAKGLTVSDVGLQLGASFTTAPLLLPNIALSGEMKIGNFIGASAVAFDTRNPTKCMISTEFNKLYMWDLVNLVVSNKIKKKINADIKEALKNTSFEQVHLQAAPVAIQVLEKNYDAGFSAGGKMNIAGFKAESDFVIDYINGIMARATVDPIDLKIFKLKGANGKERPGFLLNLRSSTAPKYAVNGAVTLLGLEGETDIHFVKDGFQFMVGGNIFHLFQGNITAKGGDIQKAEEMYLKVKMQQDFLDFIKKDVSGAVKKSTSAGVSKLRAAHKDLGKAEKAVKAWDKKIITKRKEIKAKQAKKRAAYNTAKKNLDAAKGYVKKLNKQIKKYQAKLKKTKKHEVAERTWLKTKIASLKTTKKGALKTLDLAKKGFDALSWVNRNPDLDPEMVYLFGKKEVSLKSVQGARLFIKGIEKGLGIGGNATSWILQNGPDAIVDIKKAEFEGRLGKLSGGAVQLKLQVKWLGKSKDLKVKFDFYDTASSVKNLVEELMKLK